MKYEKFIDSKKFLELKKEAAEAANKVIEGIEALRAEGIPTDQQTIEKLTATPTALEEYIRSAALARIGTGFVAQEERSRIFEVYSHLLARIKNKVELMRISLPTVPIIFDGDQVTIDDKKMEKIAKDAATSDIDMAGLEEYYGKVQEIQAALDNLRAYEMAHGLPDFRREGFMYEENGNFMNPKLEDYFHFNPCWENFERIARGYFTKK